MSVPAVIVPVYDTIVDSGRSDGGVHAVGAAGAGAGVADPKGVEDEADGTVFVFGPALYCVVFDGRILSDPCQTPALLLTLHCVVFEDAGCRYRIPVRPTPCWLQANCT